ncbi:formate dehydrogenase accessory sulfurtransferase FdhD [Dongia rigui]|uniref:Sulfur carrier protein FdhD n=1 Tax=Dongia rigui TaxID=940149 RepID=A0ABU5DY15_9PROT|nr:formate dehydrogenase accessory sulfurtransferase FdhD [Dongia rigui]MDY0872204.1 formate dehydrogenase accessory sulfurtransferase FdhD [Dongia rigui]
MAKKLQQSGEATSAGDLPPMVRPAKLRQLGFDGSQVDRLDFLAEEVPVALVYNGISHAVMMASPADLEDFARGFSLSEGIIQHAAEIRDVEVVPHEKGIELNIDLASERFHQLKERRRTIAGRTGCGLCGLDSLEAVARDLPRVTAATRVPLAAIDRALRDLPAAQVHNAQAHALHAAAFADTDGQLLFVREDVGRHNALDKLIGAITQAKIDPAGGFALITSRCSLEMVQKTAIAGLPILVSVSAPTALATRLADDAGLTLLALARRDSVLSLTHPHRLLP